MKNIHHYSHVSPLPEILLRRFHLCIVQTDQQPGTIQASKKEARNTVLDLHDVPCSDSTIPMQESSISVAHR